MHTPKIDTVFINLQSDYGFKRTFGTEKYKKAVIRLLDAALGDEIKVTSLTPRLQYQSKEYCLMTKTVRESYMMFISH